MKKEKTEIADWVKDALDADQAIGVIDREMRVRSGEVAGLRDACADQWVLLASKKLGMSRSDFVSMCWIVTKL